MTMKLCTPIFVSALTAAPLLQADNPGTDVQVVPAHFSTCAFRQGKGPDDLERLTRAFNEYVGEESDYTYWILTPRFREDTEVHFIWLGTWDSGAGFGAGFDAWVSDAGEVEAMFYDTAECSGHMAAITPIAVNPENPLLSGIVWFSRCTLNEGASMTDSIKAHATRASAMLERGVEIDSWAFLPTMGFGDLEFNYYHVAAYDSYAELGTAFDITFNEGSTEVSEDGIREAVSCASPNLYDFELQRRGT